MDLLAGTDVVLVGCARDRANEKDLDKRGY
jgi:hypothetical protein